MEIKVCHLTTVHTIEDVRIFKKECISLAVNGFDVTMIACGDTAFEDTVNGVRRILLNFPIKNRLQRILKRPKAIYKRALGINADIYHLHDPELLPIGLKLIKRGYRVVYDAHEDLPAQVLYKPWIQPIFRKILSSVIKQIEHYYVTRLSAVVTVNESISNRLLIRNDNVIICRNYASLKEFGILVDFNEERNNICYIGVLSKIRGIANVAAAATISNTIFEIAGSFESDAFQEQVINSNVIYHGIADKEKIREIFSDSFAGIVTFLPSPNHIFSSPNKLFEYMAAGLPVIASNFDAWRPIIEENKLGILVDPSNIEDIANSILYLKNNPSAARQMGENGRRAFETRYNWETEEPKLIELYKKIHNSLKKDFSTKSL